jgi:hypothetical protein
MPETYNPGSIIPAPDPAVSDLVPSYFGPEGRPKAADQWRYLDLPWLGSGRGGPPWTLRILTNEPLHRLRVLLIDPDGNAADLKAPYRADIEAAVTLATNGLFRPSQEQDRATADDPYANVTGANVPRPV